jgi:hypothetical protein
MERGIFQRVYMRANTILQTFMMGFLDGTHHGIFNFATLSPIPARNLYLMANGVGRESVSVRRREA